MTRIETLFHSHLLAHPGLTAIVGNRVYMIARPTGSALPAITLHLISNIDQRDLDATAYMQARIQVSCWTTTWGDAKALPGEIRAAVETVRELPGIIDAEVVHEREDYDGEAQIYHVPVDVLIKYDRNEIGG